MTLHVQTNHKISISVRELKFYLQFCLDFQIIKPCIQHWKSCSSKKVHWLQLTVLTLHDNRFMYLQTGYSLCPFHFYNTRINTFCLLLEQGSSLIISKREHKDFLTASSLILHQAPNGQIHCLNFLFVRQEDIHWPETIPEE